LVDIFVLIELKLSTQAGLEEKDHRMTSHPMMDLKTNGISGVGKQVPIDPREVRHVPN
jgi:hypothetical protein